MDIPGPNDIVFVGKTHAYPIPKTDRFLNFILESYLQYKERAGKVSMEKFVPTAIDMWKVFESKCLESVHYLDKDTIPVVMYPIKFWVRCRSHFDFYFVYSPVPLEEAHKMIYQWLRRSTHCDVKNARKKAKETTNKPRDNRTLLKMVFFALLVMDAALAPDSRTGHGVAHAAHAVPTARERPVYRTLEDEANNRQLVVENAEWWFEMIDEYREKKEEKRIQDLKRRKKPLPDLAKRDERAEKYASGRQAYISMAQADRTMTPIQTWRISNNAQWITKQLQLFNLVKNFFLYLTINLGMDAPRDAWTEYTENDMQTFFACIATAAAQDERLFKLIIVLQKLGIFNVEALAEIELRKLQNIILYVGYNLWPYLAGYLIGAAKQIRDLYDGKLPPAEPIVLLRFWGVDRKIMMIILHDVYGQKMAGIGCDTHVHAVAFALRWCDSRNSKTAARQMEGWIPDDYYFDLNLVFGSIRQLWQKSKDNQVRIETVAKEQGVWDVIRKVVRAGSVSKQ